MATAAFKSTTKRSSIGGTDDTPNSSSGGRRRTRSVSRFSHRLPSELIDFERKTPLPSTRRKFVNTVRGAGFPEISLDDLAIQLFSSGERGRSSDIFSSETAAAQRRGRSVSRQSSSGNSVIGGRSSRGGDRIGADRRRCSLSVVRYRASDSESDDHCDNYTCHGNVKTSNGGNKPKATSHKKAAPTQIKALRRCSSQTDFLKLHDSCSSQSYSSTVTDDEACDACYGSDGYKKSDLFMRNGANSNQLEAVLKKHRNAVEETRMGLQQRSNEKQSISRRLKEDAEKIIEDFISSVEDNTDMSSFDGERSDTSTAVGVSMRPRDNLMSFGEAEKYKTPPRTCSLPTEMDGVVFPWLLWETSTDDTPQFKDRKQTPTLSNTSLHEGSNIDEQKHSIESNSSRGSCSPVLAEETHKSRHLKYVPRRSRVADVDAYLALPSNEELLIERWKLTRRIASGGILLCEGSSVLGLL